uniref:Uncharacterized protein n=1 Tax=Globodera rostochiensis TaxID=31243 RepID=A0A914HCS9_GLORO
MNAQKLVDYSLSASVRAVPAAQPISKRRRRRPTGAFRPARANDGRAAAAPMCTANSSGRINPPSDRPSSHPAPTLIFLFRHFQSHQLELCSFAPFRDHHPEGTALFPRRKGRAPPLDFVWRAGLGRHAGQGGVHHTARAGQMHAPSVYAPSDQSAGGC